MGPVEEIKAFEECGLVEVLGIVLKIIRNENPNQPVANSLSPLQNLRLINRKIGTNVGGINFSKLALINSEAKKQKNGNREKTLIKILDPLIKNPHELENRKNPPNHKQRKRKDRSQGSRLNSGYHLCLPRD
jgi:hypothetical protein